MNKIIKNHERNNIEANNTIHTPIGDIKWGANNLQLRLLMEAIEEKIETHDPNSIAALIESLT